ncbi:unnamed protein product [Brassica oleracea var. botrytis]
MAGNLCLQIFDLSFDLQTNLFRLMIHIMSIWIFRDIYQQMSFCTKLGVLQNRNVPMLASLRYMSTKLFVGGLSRGTDDHSLKDAFSTFNGVTEAKVMTNKVTGRSRGYGFVNFISEDSAKSAISAMDG